MADKLTFAMQVFFLGFSVVMVVLFFLYGLISFTNWLRDRLSEKAEPEDPMAAEGDRLSPQLVAAVTAVVNHYRVTSSDYKGPVRIRVSLAEVKGSRWAAAGRRALLENSSALERLRRK